MNRNFVAAAALPLAVFAFLGCYEPVAVTWYAPGVYKGASDPLLESLAKGDLQQALEARLRDVQTDR